MTRVTTGDPTRKHKGHPILAWHFITDKGHHFMLDADGKAKTFNGKTRGKVVEIEESDMYGTE